MSRHFAQIDEKGVVARVVVAESIEWCEGALGGRWVETFMETEGHNYAGIGYTVRKADSKLKTEDNFIPIKPYDSWLLDEVKCIWKAPVEEPKDKLCIWDEEKKIWRELSVEDAEKLTDSKIEAK